MLLNLGPCIEPKKAYGFAKHDIAMNVHCWAYSDRMSVNSTAVMETHLTDKYKLYGHRSRGAVLVKHFP